MAERLTNEETGMLESNIEILRAVMAADPSITPADRRGMLALLRGHGKTGTAPAAPTASAPRVVRRRESARLLGCSLRQVDNLGRTGVLRRIKLPNRVRACGFNIEDLESLIRSRA